MRPGGSRKWLMYCVLRLCFNNTCIHPGKFEGIDA
jgi:hypothetical protein